MTGYTRQDLSNNISNGSVIDADDLDLEFNAVETSFNTSTGHKHDGTSGEGAPITVVGPAQDVVTTSTQMAPKADDTYDLGSATNKWKDLYVDGVAYLDAVNLDGTAITATAGEINSLAGLTATSSELNILDGATVTTAELNVLDGIPVGLTSTKLGYLDVTTLGSSQVSKVVTADANGDVKFSNAIVETVFSLSGTTPALNPNNGTIQTWTLTANSTPTDGLAAGESMTLLVDDGAAYSIAWPTITWKTNFGSAPTLLTSGLTVIVLWKVGSTLYGARVGNA
jgi:hypothetical protein